MSHCNIDFVPRPLDAFDERRAAETQARAVCEQLNDDDASSMVSRRTRLMAALTLIIGTLVHCMSRVELARMLVHLAEQVECDGIVVQHGRIMSLD